MGAGSVGCLGYGLSVLGFAVCVFAGFFFFRQNFKKKSEALEDGPKRIPLTRDDRPFVFQFFAFCLCGAVLFFAAHFIEVRGVEAGWFEGQTECPGIWLTPRSLRDRG